MHEKVVPILQILDLVLVETIQGSSLLAHLVDSLFEHECLTFGLSDHFLKFHLHHMMMLIQMADASRESERVCVRVKCNCRRIDVTVLLQKKMAMRTIGEQRFVASVRMLTSIVVVTQGRAHGI